MEADEAVAQGSTLTFATVPTGDGWVDFGPSELPDSRVVGIFEKRLRETPGAHRNFMTDFGVDEDDRPERKVSGLQVPTLRYEDLVPAELPEFQGFVLYKNYDQDCLEVLQDRVHIDPNTFWGETQHLIELIRIFAQEAL